MLGSYSESLFRTYQGPVFVSLSVSIVVPASVCFCLFLCVYEFVCHCICLCVFEPFIWACSGPIQRAFLGHTKVLDLSNPMTKSFLLGSLCWACPGPLPKAFSRRAKVKTYQVP